MGQDSECKRGYYCVYPVDVPYWIWPRNQSIRRGPYGCYRGSAGTDPGRVREKICGKPERLFVHDIGIADGYCHTDHIAAIALRWVRIMRLNSEKQIQQNEEIIGLLKESVKEGRR